MSLSSGLFIPQLCGQIFLYDIGPAVHNEVVLKSPTCVIHTYSSAFMLKFIEYDLEKNMLLLYMLKNNMKWILEKRRCIIRFSSTKKQKNMLPRGISSIISHDTGVIGPLYFSMCILSNVIYIEFSKYYPLMSKLNWIGSMELCKLTFCSANIGSR